MTLIGGGSAGKTRLVLHVADHVVPDGADEVVWVECAPWPGSGLV